LVCGPRTSALDNGRKKRQVSRPGAWGYPHAPGAFETKEQKLKQRVSRDLRKRKRRAPTGQLPFLFALPDERKLQLCREDRTLYNTGKASAPAFQGCIQFHVHNDSSKTANAEIGVPRCFEGLALGAPASRRSLQNYGHLPGAKTYA
jgi:hypothetical protein